MRILYISEISTSLWGHRICYVTYVQTNCTGKSIICLPHLHGNEKQTYSSENCLMSLPPLVFPDQNYVHICSMWRIPFPPHLTNLFACLPFACASEASPGQYWILLLQPGHMQQWHCNRSQFWLQGGRCPGINSNKHGLNTTTTTKPLIPNKLG
jgi:hypothetical protein